MSFAPWPEQRTAVNAVATVLIMAGFYFVLEQVLPTDAWYQEQIVSRFSSEFWFVDDA